jgi:ribonuclease J
MISREALADTAPGELLVLAGGTQGESGSAMQRLAAQTHPYLKLAPGDMTIFSSRIIPGNDRKVFKMMNALLRQGVIMHSAITDPHVHTSGHGARDEQSRMIELLRPKSFMPIHGTLHHLIRHADLARDLGIDEIAIVENGQSVELEESKLRHGPRVAAGHVSISYDGQELSERILEERVELGRGGSASFALAIDRKGNPATDPELITRGIPAIDEKPGRLSAIARQVVEGLGEQIPEWRKQHRDVRKELALLVRRHIERQSGSRVRVDVHLLEL